MKICDCTYKCTHRPMGYKYYGSYTGTNGESPVTRRNIHDHNYPYEYGVNEFLL